MSSFQMNNRHRIVAAMARLHGASLDALLSAVSALEAQGIRSAWDHHATQGDDVAVDRARQELHALRASDQFSGLADVHPAWLLESLTHEPPRVIGIVLRSLPSHHVRYIIEHLPVAMRDALPDLIEAFAVPPDILEVIRRRFERRFLPVSYANIARETPFEGLHTLKNEELLSLVRELGLAELALALSRMSSRAVRLLLNRFPLKVAKSIQNKMKELEGCSESLRHQAQFTVLGVTNEHMGSDQLLLEAGVASLGRAGTATQDRFYRWLQQKLEPRLGYLLRRSLDEWGTYFSDEGIQERQALVLDTLHSLRERGVIHGRDTSIGIIEEAVVHFS